MQGLFPSLCANLVQLGDLVKPASEAHAHDHRQRLATLNDLLIGHYEALALFLAHPTRRLSDLLLAAVIRAEEATGWLIEHPPASQTAAPHDFSYPAICERLRRGVADWRLSINLKAVYHDLDELPLETFH
jgi:hypothetical protein